MLAVIGHFLAAHAIAAFMLSVGLETDRAVWRGLAVRWRLLVRALAVVWIGVPLLALLVVYAIRPSPLGAAALVVTAICPGVPIVLRSVRKAYGDRETSLQILIATSLTAVVMVPLWVVVLARFTPLQLTIAPHEVALILFPTVIVPFALGRIVNELWPRIAGPLAKAAKVVFFAGNAILFAVVVIESFPALRQLPLRGLLAVACVTLGAAALGYAAGGPRRDQRISVAYAAALGNPALALAVVSTAARASVLPLVGGLVLIRTLVLLPLGLWFARRRDPTRRSDDLRARVTPLASPAAPARG